MWGDSSPESAPNCDGAFAKIPAPYMANTLFNEAGAFVADAEGLIFSVLADSTRATHIADYPMLLLKSDLSGNLETLYTCSDAEMIGTVVKAGDDAFVVLGLLNRVIARVQRGGGDPATVTDNRLEAGPVSDGKQLYYSAKPKAGEGDASHVRSTSSIQRRLSRRCCSIRATSR